MRKDRILRLADHMEAQKKKKLDQSVWAHDVSSRKATFRKLPGGKWQIIAKEGFCGSAGCVLGHGATMPDMGLTMYAQDYYVSDETGRRRASEVMVAALNEKGEIETDIMGYEAGALALDIPPLDAELLFGPGYLSTRAFYSQATRFLDIPDWMPSPQDVAAALRNYVATDGASAALARQVAKGS